MSQLRLIELFVYSQIKTTKDGKKFTKYSTKADFFMVDTDVNEKGEAVRTVSKERVPHFIDIAFTEDAFETSKVKKSEITRGILTVDASKVGLPDEYEITTKDGKKVYPLCWIRGGMEKFTPKTKEHEFHFILEEDTNEVEIDEESND